MTQTAKEKNAYKHSYRNYWSLTSFNFWTSRKKAWVIEKIITLNLSVIIRYSLCRLWTLFYIWGSFGIMPFGGFFGKYYTETTTKYHLTFSDKNVLFFFNKTCLSETGSSQISWKRLKSPSLTQVYYCSLGKVSSSDNFTNRNLQVHVLT